MTQSVGHLAGTPGQIMYELGTVAVAVFLCFETPRGIVEVLEDGAIQRVEQVG